MGTFISTTTFCLFLVAMGIIILLPALVAGEAVLIYLGLVIIVGSFFGWLRYVVFAK